MKKLILLSILFFSTNVFAGFHCEVDVKRVLVYGNGIVNVIHTGREGYTHICNLKTERLDVDIVTCAMWTSLLQNTIVNDKQAVFYYDGEGSCATLPTYASSPAPTYIGIID